MDVIWLDSKLLVELFLVDFVLLFLAGGVCELVGKFHGLRSVHVLSAVDEIKLVDLTGTKKSEVVFLALVIDSVELGESGICARYIAVPEETPNLAESHRERFFALRGFNLLGIDLVPVLQVGVVPE